MQLPRAGKIIGAPLVKNVLTIKCAAVSFLQTVSRQREGMESLILTLYLPLYFDLIFTRWRGGKKIKEAMVGFFEKYGKSRGLL